MTKMVFDVLIVDDDPIVVHALEGVLRARCTCRVALAGQRGLELMRRRPPDIVLIDAEMPGMSGFDVLRVMRDDEQLAQIPAVMLTGHADEHFHQEALESGAVDFLTKPVSSSILLARIEAHVRMGRAHRALRQDSLAGRQELQRTLRELAQSHQSLAMAASRLDEANKRLRRFVHIASHDIREPLNTVAQFAGLIQSDAPGGLPPPLDRYLDRVLAGASRMRVLLDDIVAYAAVQDGGSEPQTNVDLNALFKSLTDAMAGPIAASGARIDIPVLPVVRGVESQLSQLFQCLLSNAIKFHQPGEPPRVSVLAIQKAVDWEIHIRDQGIGVDANVAQRIFQPFVRLHLRTSYEGSGLGLAIAREIALQHGSDIELSSAPGEGADFSVRLKAA